MNTESSTITKPRPYNDCVVLDKDTFDPEAVFMDDIVDDDVLPTLSLAVDGLTTPVESAGGKMELPEDSTAVDEVIKPSTRMPVTRLDPEQLEVYGWESSIWRKIRGYLGF